MIFLDSETVGFHGMMVLLQYAENDGEIKLWDVWHEKIEDTLTLLEWIANQDVCMFNAVFDWFHISKIYTTFSLFPDHSECPKDHIEEIAILEEQARFLNLCIKPKSCCDVMLHARKSTFQSLMSRGAIRVRKIPSPLVDQVAGILEERVSLDGIYFAKRKDKTLSQWQITDCLDENGDIDPKFCNIVLKFNASTSLKDLAKFALKVKEDFILKFTDIEPNPKWNPVELGYAPYALAVGKPGKWRGAWPEVIKFHIDHWHYNTLARKYAKNDVVYTRDLYKYFGSPESGDDDSELACAVASSRWRGFAIDREKMLKLREIAKVKVGNTPTSPSKAKIYLSQVMDVTERIVLTDTKATTLESIGGKQNGETWDGGWLSDDDTTHLAAVRAREILTSRRAAKEIENYDKLLLANHFHASLNIIGALSSRMSGADGLNAQGIKNAKTVRESFPLADFVKGEVLSGGDFVSFEVVLAEAVYKDDNLRRDLQAGKSIHALFAEELFDLSYDEIVKTKNTTSYYTDGKRGIFSQLYGGDENTMVDRLGVDLETATKASEGFVKRYPGIGEARKRIFNKFCSMRQPGGIGSAVEWHEPKDYIESLLGFRRYFTLENKICKILFDLAQNPPKSWKAVRVKVKRRDRLQTASGAVQSALYAAAFNIQASNLRAAANHEIQSTGAGITKSVQRQVCDLQPYGVHLWVVRTLQIHDEVHTISQPHSVDKIASVVDAAIDNYRVQVPLLKIDWHKKETSWASK